MAPGYGMQENTAVRIVMRLFGLSITVASPVVSCDDHFNPGHRLYANQVRNLRFLPSKQTTPSACSFHTLEYVNDLLLTGRHTSVVKRLTTILVARCATTDLGESLCLLGCKMSAISEKKRWKSSR